MSRTAVRRFVTFAAAGILVATIAPPAAADDQPPRPASSNSELNRYLASIPADELRNREDLGEFQNWIVTQPSYPDGLVVTKDDGKARKKSFLWHNYQSSKFYAKVVAEAKRRGIATDFVETKYDYATFDAAARKLMASAPTSAFGNQFKISAIAGVDFDFDGLTVEGSYVSKTGAVSAQAKSEIAATVDQTAEALTGVAVQVVETGPVENSVTRTTDLPAFNAGGFISNGSEVCSSGFAVYLAGVGRRTTTSRHCKGVWRAVNRSASYYGPVIRTVDIAQANILSATGSALIFNGGPNDSNGPTMTVRQLQDVSLNGEVCVSGGNSGVKCGIQILNMYILFDDGQGAQPMIRARHINGQKVHAGGDSGGPVLVPYSDGKIGAVGMIQAGSDRLDYGTGCARLGAQNVYSAWCYADVWFSSTRTMINNMPSGSYLVTG